MARIGMEATVAQAFTSKEFRSALGAFATGVTVITTGGEEHAYGMTANAFSSVSLDPPLVLVCAKIGAEGSKHIDRNGCFAVNILAVDQEPLSRYFSSKDRPRGRDAFRDVPHRTEVTPSPILEGVVAYLDCRLHETHTAGDHEIFIGEVLALRTNPDISPLLFYGGGYGFLRDEG
jgi:flavin reductase